ncbi:MAG: Pectate lyase superfamily protein, partial [Paenibacillus sp.]|nr:Pectate lyase superfamily protein [Paenibacillus sp.]
MTENRNNPNESGSEPLNDIGSSKKLSRRKLLSVAGTAAVAGMLFPRSVAGLTGNANTVTGSVYGNQECEQPCSEHWAQTVREFNERGVNLKSLGAVADGITDNSAILNQALIDHVHVFVPPGEFVVKNMDIPSGSIISGIEGLSVLKAKSYNDVGQYVDTLFDIQSKERIIFKGITFDGGITASTYVGTNDKTKVRNLLRFRESKNIRFESCTFTRFVSNTINVGVRVAGDFVRWHLAAFEECDGVHFEGGQLVNTFLEGITGYKTKNLTFDKFFSNNTRLSTPIA